jgi:hypothetical protein
MGRLWTFRETQVRTITCPVCLRVHHTQHTALSHGGGRASDFTNEVKGRSVKETVDTMTHDLKENVKDNKFCIFSLYILL